MKIIPPFQVSDISLVSSTVSATDTSASGSWAVGTTYALGDVVQVDSPTFTFTASGSTLTATAHGWLDDAIVQVSSSGTLPAGLVAGVLYYIVQAATNTLKLSLTKGGSPIITTSAGTGTHTITVSSHHLYESLTGSNVGNYPHKSASYWLDLGYTNRHKPFDGSITSQVENADSASYVFQIKGRINSVALFNLSAKEIVLTARESGGGAIVYGPATYQLASTYGITDWWLYFFDPILRTNVFLDIDLPAYADMQITVTINDPSATVKCGAIIMGLSKTLGLSQMGAALGIVDYSVKAKDEFGNYTVQERTFSKRGSFQVWVESGQVDAVQQFLEELRATPVVYIGANEYDSTMIFGFYKDFSTTIQYVNYSICSLELEGLT